MIEKGRHDNNPQEIRFCPFCENIVEDEIPFLMQYKTYDVLRKASFGKYLKPNFQNFDVSKQFTLILEDISEVAKTA